MPQDKMLRVSLLGVISTIPSEVVSRIFVYMGLGKFSIYELASLTITFNRPNFIIGLIVDLIVSAIFSFLLYLVFNKFGSDHPVIKTAVGSLLAWLLCELLFTSTIEGKYIKIRPINDYYSHIISTIIFGITLGLLLKKIIFKSR